MSDIKNNQQNLSSKKRELYKLLMDEKKVLKKNTECITIPIDRKGNEFPLSYAQQRIWFMEQLMPCNTAYNIPSAVWLEGRLDPFALEQSLNEIIRRHESLKTTFEEMNGSPMQVIIPELKITMPIIDIVGVSKEERQAKIHEFVAKDNQKPHNLLEGPLIRVTLLRFGEEDHALVLNMHHIISDGWSMRIFMQEMAMLYKSCTKGKDIILDKPTVQYIDYAIWQRKYVENGYDKKKIDYWKDILKGSNFTLNLLLDYKRPPLPSFKGARHYFEIPEELTALLNDLANKKRNTLFMVLMASFKVLLFRYTGQEDIIVGTPVAGRTLPELEALIGFFVNMLVLRSDFSGNPTFNSYLDTIGKMMPEVYTHQDIPFEVLVEEIQPDRDLSRNPLFQIVFGYQSESAAFIELPGLTLNMVEFDSGTARFDLELQLWKEDKKIKGYFEYSSDLFNSRTIAGMSEHFLIMLNSIASNPQQTVLEMPILTDMGKNDLLTRNNLDTDYSVEECIHQLFEMQAAKTPDAVAIVFKDKALTYAELNFNANKMANHLVKSGIEPGKYVGLYIERSMDMVVAILAVVKAGGAYVPIDPSYPIDRLTFILEDSKPDIVITHSSNADIFVKLGVKVMLIDGEYKSNDDKNPNIGVTPENPAYVIYTSGSTGKPKGVIVTHNNATRLFEATKQLFLFNEKDVWTLFHSYAFDFSVWELWGALIYGGRLVVVSYETSRAPQDFYKLILREGVTVLNQTPSFFKQLIKAQEELGIYDNTSLRYIIFGGEALDIDGLEPWFKRYGDETPRLVNMYGITETTVHVTYRLLSKEDLRKSTKSVIGHPIPDLQVYLLDKYHQPVPVGIPGEIYVGGAGVACGYLNRPELTSERFISDPFCGKPGARLYRSGDLARLLHNGELEYLGRIDHQVKIRGYRIELGEIESLLIQLPQVHSAAVTIYSETPDEKCLAAYIQYKDTQDISIDRIREYLREKLPEYMIPSYFIVVDSFPITINGKLDYGALPDPKKSSVHSEVDYQAPRFELERIITGIWQEVLNIDRVGINDNFFDLGGHSMSMAQVHSKLSKKIHREIKMIDFFKYTTVSTLANYLNMGQTEVATIHNYYENAKERVKERVKEKDINDTDIAIIAISMRFPGANNPEEFWQNLRDGVESITFFTEDEVLDSGVSPEMARDPNYVKADGILEKIEYFDASFFGYSPREAEMIDPQQRIFLECAWEAFERGGYDTELYKGKIGVFVSSNMSTYLFNNIYNPNDAIGVMGNFQVRIPYLMGNDKDFLATRIAYKLNLQGPALSVQTACSSTMVGTHLACRCLTNRECDMALVGGVTIKVPQKMGYLYQEGGVPSPDGHTRSFDVDGKGAAPANGVGMVVLKRLRDAIADGDNIHAVIKGMAMNNDGALKAGFTAPSVEGQSKVIADALAVSGIEPETITYIEANGTATQLGDAMEIDALTQVFHASTRKNEFCGIGSVKTNIGHLDTANGIAGLIKTALAIKHRMIPPSLNYKKPNPNIDFSSTPFYVNTTLKEWDSGDIPIRAGVNSFGIGGTNVHAVLQECSTNNKDMIYKPYYLLTLSAKSSSALNAMTNNLANFINNNQNIDISDVAYTLAVGRKGFDFRKAVVCKKLKDAVELLQESSFDREVIIRYSESKPMVVFMFDSENAYHPSMIRDLYEFDYLFRKEIDICCDIFKSLTGIDIKRILKDSVDYIQEHGKKQKTHYLIQIEMFIVEYVLAKGLMEWGIKPQAVFGEGIGEYVAACVSEAYSLNDIIKLIVIRNELLLPELQQSNSIIVNKPAVPFASNITEKWVTGCEKKDDKVWSKYLHESIHMKESVVKLCRNKGEIILSIGMGNAIGKFINEDNTEIIDLFNHHILDEKGIIYSLLFTIGKMWSKGIGFKWSEFYKNDKYLRIILPTYPFERKRYWIEPSKMLTEGDTKLTSQNDDGYKKDTNSYKNISEHMKFNKDVQEYLNKSDKMYTRPQLRNEYVPPRTDFEKTLVSIWERYIGVKPIGVYDNIYELGGDSIIGLQIASRAFQEGYKVTSKQIFTSQTISKLSKNVSKAWMSKNDQSIITGDVYLTPIQHWFFKQNITQKHHFNQSILLGTKIKLNKEFVKHVVKRLLIHHDALRMRYKYENPIWYQFIGEVDDFVPFQYFDLSELCENEKNVEFLKLTDEMQTSLELYNGQLVRVALFNMGDGYQDRLLFIAHHLVIDGVSWRILIEDFQSSYMQLEKNKEIVLPVKTMSYKQWAANLIDYSKSDNIKSAYWKEKSKIQVNQIPVDFNNCSNVYSDSQSYSLSLGIDETTILLQEVPKVFGVKINDVLIAALARSFKTWMDSGFIAVDIETHGRYELSEEMDLSRTIGWFTSIFPIFISINNYNDIESQITNIKEEMHDSYNHGLSYGVLKYILNEEELINIISSAQICFVYLGQYDQTLEESSMFDLLDRPCGTLRSPEAERPYLLEICLYVTNKVLKIEWIYSKQVHLSSSIKELADSYLNELRSIIKHCCLKRENVHGTSQFNYVDICKEELDEIITELS